MGLRYIIAPLLVAAACGWFVAAPVDAAGPERASGRLHLGEQLFFDTKLSGDMTLRCADCHQPEHGFADGQALSRGYAGSRYFRNAPGLLHATEAPAWFRDGRGRQAGPGRLRAHLLSAHFLNVDERLLQERLYQAPGYRNGFQTHYGGPPRLEHVLDALYRYLASLRTVPDHKAQNGPAAQRGAQVFNGPAGCAVCHSGPQFSDGEAHRLGVPEHPQMAADPLRQLTLRAFLHGLRVPGYTHATTDPGAGAVDAGNTGQGAFLTPGLRGLVDTAPYMHNGVLETLESVVDFHLAGGGPGSELGRVELSAGQRADLLAYLRSLGRSPETTPEPSVPQFAVLPDGAPR